MSELSLSPERKVEVISRVTSAVLTRRDLTGLFQAVWETINELFPAATELSFQRYFADKQYFEVVASNKKGNIGVRFDDTESTPGGILFKMNRTMMINDMDVFAQQSGVDLRDFYKSQFGSGIAVMLQHGDKALGYMSVRSDQKGAFTQEDKTIMDALGGVVSLAFENALAFDEINRLKETAEAQGAYLREEVESFYPVNGMVGKSLSFKTVLKQIEQVAKTDSTVLIEGETGTGKEVVARAIHERSNRSDKPLIKLNCGALPENLVESELFGHERGSFTGAAGRRIGRFELADGGTIFLDEIGEMPLSLQVKLLRVLQEQEFERVGGEKPIQVDVRVIAATNRDLRTEVAAGRFRADLYYRLNVFPIAVSPLRSRPEDAVLLAKHFVKQTANRMGGKGYQLSNGSLNAVQNYPWPGNVRELEHLVERAVILSQNGMVNLEALLAPGSGTNQQATVAFPDSKPPAPIATPNPVPMPSAPAENSAPSAPKADAAPPSATPDTSELLRNQKPAVSLKESFLEAEKTAIESALAECDGVIGGKNGAAARLGLKRQTLQSKMKKLGITLSRPRRAVSN